MIYVNQLEHADMPYRHIDGLENVKISGCGLCCLCMIVGGLTVQQLSIEDCVQMSYEHGGNLLPGIGTDMDRMGPAVAERFSLSFEKTDDAQTLAEHLHRGGMAIALVRADPETHQGLFTKGGHYITVVSYDGRDVCILDPSDTPEKYEEPWRKGRVRKSPPFIWCPLETLHGETKLNQRTSYYLFARKKPE